MGEGEAGREKDWPSVRIKFKGEKREKGWGELQDFRLETTNFLFNIVQIIHKQIKNKQFFLGLQLANIYVNITEKTSKEKEPNSYFSI